MGRAGKIHLACLQESHGDAMVCWLVDTKAEVLAPYKQGGTKLSTDVAEALRDEAVSCVIVSTPTPHHARLIHAALAAGKHVFAEKPLCCGAQEAGDRFAPRADSPYPSLDPSPSPSPIPSPAPAPTEP